MKNWKPRVGDPKLASVGNMLQHQRCSRDIPANRRVRPNLPQVVSRVPYSKQLTDPEWQTYLVQQPLLNGRQNSRSGNEMFELTTFGG
jgi:hypothetical protein